MSAVLGLLGLVAFAACVIGLAAAVTWTVVKALPADRAERKQKSAA